MARSRPLLVDLWRKLWRRFFTFPGVQWITAVLVAGCIWFVWLTCKKRYKNAHVFREYASKPVIFAFWHGRSMMLSPVIIKFGFKGYAISSRHRDGRLMAKLQRMFGLKAIYGSTGRAGAVSALRQGVRVLHQGDLLCLSPDGPKGPRMRLHDGVLYFSKMSGAPIISVCFSCSRPWIQKRWDKYMVARPFSRITLSASEPFYVGKSANMEMARKDLEDIMIKQMQDMDSSYKLPIIEPDDIRKKK